MSVSFTASEEWQQPCLRALPELQLQRRHRAATVRSEGGHQPAVQPAPACPAHRRPLSPVPITPRERAEPAGVIAPGRRDHPWLPVQPRPAQPGAAVPDVSPQRARSAAASSAPASTSGLSCRDSKQKAFPQLICRSRAYCQLTDCACGEEGRVRANSGLCCLISHSDSSVK